MENETPPAWLGADLVAFAAAFVRVAEANGTATEVARAQKRLAEAHRLVVQGLALTQHHVSSINALKAEIWHQALMTTPSAEFVAALADARAALVKQFPFGPDLSHHPRTMDDIVAAQTELDERAARRADAREANEKKDEPAGDWRQRQDCSAPTRLRLASRGT